MQGDDAAEGTIGLTAGLKEIYARMSRKRRRQLYVVLILMALGVVAELGTIGAIMPFLALLAGNAQPDRRMRLLAIPEALGGANPLLFRDGLFVVFALGAGLIRLQLAGPSRNFIFRLGHELSVEIQR